MEGEERRREEEAIWFPAFTLTFTDWRNKRIASEENCTQESVPSFRRFDASLTSCSHSLHKSEEEPGGSDGTSTQAQTLVVSSPFPAPSFLVFQVEILSPLIFKPVLRHLCVKHFEHHVVITGPA